MSDDVCEAKMDDPRQERLFTVSVTATVYAQDGIDAAEKVCHKLGSFDVSRLAVMETEEDW